MLEATLLNETFVEIFLLVTAFATPFLAICLLFLDVIKFHRLWWRHPYFWLFSLSGPLIFILWHVYNAVVDAHGLDSVKALLINVGIFVALGLLLGIIIRIWRRRLERSP